MSISIYLSIYLYVCICIHTHIQTNIHICIFMSNVVPTEAKDFGRLTFVAVSFLGFPVSRLSSALKDLRETCSKRM